MALALRPLPGSENFSDVREDPLPVSDALREVIIRSYHSWFYLLLY